MAAAEISAGGGSCTRGKQVLDAWMWLWLNDCLWYSFLLWKSKWSETGWDQGQFFKTAPGHLDKVLDFELCSTHRHEQPNCGGIGESWAPLQIQVCTEFFVQEIISDQWETVSSKSQSKYAGINLSLKWRGYVAWDCPVWGKKKKKRLLHSMHMT